jgi:hypothetical protein
MNTSLRNMFVYSPVVMNQYLEASTVWRMTFAPDNGHLCLRASGKLAHRHVADSAKMLHLTRFERTSIET